MSEQRINITQLLQTFEFFDKNKDGAISSSEVSSIKIHKNYLFFEFYSFDQHVKNYTCLLMKQKCKNYFKVAKA